MTDVADVFAAFRSEAVSQTPLRAAITAAYRRPEPECVAPSLPRLEKRARGRTKRRGFRVQRSARNSGRLAPSAKKQPTP
jgi:RHH-type transcriptional regulator, proline utilization regulon repressor / proline dehydrogenase / delta 1-pyrroline-5-carboxylate dehydrogenase